MAVETTTDVDEMTAVQTGEGEAAPPANANEQAQIRDSLGNFESGIDGTVSDDGTVTSLPPQSIPDGVEVLIQADYANADRVAVGLTDTPAVELRPGQSMTYRVADLSQIRVEATSSGDGVAFTAEVSA